MKMKSQSNTLVIMTFVIFTFSLSSCGKKAHESLVKESTSKIEKPSKSKLKALRIGQAENFSILASDSITSDLNSLIYGKVGLFPGTRENIKMQASEVSGGRIDIYGSDDETDPINLLSNAKVDLVLAYKEALALSADKDKSGLSGNNLGAKSFSPGCYKWNEDLFIKNDIIINGSESDVFIFKIPNNLKISSGVHMTLSGGAKAKNIFWQVGGKAEIGSESIMVGTILAEGSIDLNSRSELTGRALSKNSYIHLNQSTVIKP